MMKRVVGYIVLFIIVFTFLVMAACNKPVQPTTFSGQKSEISVEAKNYNATGLAFAQQGQYQQAIEDYNQAIRLKPDFAGAYAARGVAYAYLGQYKNARENYDEAIRLKPNNKGTYYNYACLFALQKDAKQACKWLRWAIEKGFKNWKQFETDKDFDSIRNEKCFVDIIKKIFKLNHR